MRPLMVYVLPSTKDRDKRIERAQRESLADPRVLQAARDFVPLKLSRSVNREELSSFGLSYSSSMEMSFVSPGRRAAGHAERRRGVRNRIRWHGSCTRRCGCTAACCTRSSQALVFENESAKTSEIKRALDLIAQFRIVAAEKDLTELLERPRLSKSLLQPAYNAMAAIVDAGVCEEAGRAGSRGSEARHRKRSATVRFLGPS